MTSLFASRASDSSATCLPASLTSATPATEATATTAASSTAPRVSRSSRPEMLVVRSELSSRSTTISSVTFGPGCVTSPAR